MVEVSSARPHRTVTESALKAEISYNIYNIPSENKPFIHANLSLIAEYHIKYIRMNCHRAVSGVVKRIGILICFVVRLFITF